MTPPLSPEELSLLRAAGRDAEVDAILRRRGLDTASDVPYDGPVSTTRPTEEPPMSRTYTRRQQSAMLARIDAELSDLRVVLQVMNATVGRSGGAVSDATGIAWNALHDAVTALEAERREVELNRSTGTTAALIAANID